jgi:hypothetical protein
MLIVLAAISALVLGFLAGLSTFKRSLMWCRICGSTLRCTVCPRHANHQGARIRL